MGPGKISSKEIQEQIEALHRDGAVAECHYASLLQALLFPSAYTPELVDVPKIVDALSASEANIGAIKIYTYLHHLITPSLGAFHDPFDA